MYVWITLKRVGESRDANTQERRCGFSTKLLCLTASFSFARLLQGHLKASNYLSFSSLLYFCGLVLGHFKTSNHHSYSSLLYFHESGIILYRKSGIIYPSPGKVWCKLKAQSHVTPSSCLVGILSRVEISVVI